MSGRCEYVGVIEDMKAQQRIHLASAMSIEEQRYVGEAYLFFMALSDQRNLVFGGLMMLVAEKQIRDQQRHNNQLGPSEMISSALGGVFTYRGIVNEIAYGHALFGHPRNERVRTPLLRAVRAGLPEEIAQLHADFDEQHCSIKVVRDNMAHWDSRFVSKQRRSNTFYTHASVNKGVLTVTNLNGTHASVDICQACEGFFKLVDDVKIAMLRGI